MKQNDRVSVSQARSCLDCYSIFMQKTQTSISQELGDYCREHLAVIVRLYPFKQTRDVWSRSQHRSVPLQLWRRAATLHCTPVG